MKHIASYKIEDLLSDFYHSRNSGPNAVDTTLWEVAQRYRHTASLEEFENAHLLLGSAALVERVAELAMRESVRLIYLAYRVRDAMRAEANTM